MLPKLQSYLRTHRLRSGLSQKDISFLLSLNSGSTISKIEKGLRPTSSKILLAYCILFNAYPYDLLPGIIHDIQDAVLKRIPLLIEKLKRQKETNMTRKRIEFLSNLYSDISEMRTKGHEKCTKDRKSQTSFGNRPHI